MWKRTDKKGNLYYHFGGIPSSVYASEKNLARLGDKVKSFVIYDKPDRLVFFKHMYDPNSKTKTTDPKCKYVLSFKNNKTNLYRIAGKSCINVTNKAVVLDIYINEFIQTFVSYRKSTPKKRNPYFVEQSIRSAIVKLILKKARKNRIKTRRFDCRAIGPGMLVTYLAYPMLMHLYKSPLEPKASVELLKEVFESNGPTLRSQSRLNPYRMVPEISKCLRGDNLSEVCKRAFGKKSKAITRLVNKRMGNSSESLTAVISILIILRGLVTIDDAQAILKDMSYPLRGIYVFHARSFLKNFSRKRIRILLTGREEWFYLSDAAKQWSAHKEEIQLPKKPKSMKQLHDYISAEYRKLQTKDYPLPILKKFQKLQGKSLGNGMTLVLPTSNYQLIEWGQKLSNCIASYAADAKQGKIQLVGVKQFGEIKYALELSPNGTLKQFRGNYNDNPEPKDEKLILEAIAA